MSQRWKVLAPIAFDEETDLAIHNAVEVANDLTADVVLLHVRHLSAFKRTRAGGWPADTLGGVETHGGLQRAVLPGTPAATISDYGDFVRADIVTMFTRRFGTSREAWNGSATADVLEGTRRPVWITRKRYVADDNPFPVPPGHVRPLPPT